MKTNSPLQITERVLFFIRRNNLIKPNQRLLVAVSGGPDSMCLLHVLFSLREELGIEIHVAHLDHMIRGAESSSDAEFVSRFASQLGIPVTIGKEDVRAYRSKLHLSLEEAARDVRYKFMVTTAEACGATCVVTGHTADDHIETVLLHLIRGAGIRGLRGLRPSSIWRLGNSRITIIRPLLEISREETSLYCQAHQLTPVIDSSNLSLSPLRNRVRQQLIPLLESYNTKVRDVLQRTAIIATDDLDFIDKSVASVWRETARESEKTIALNKEKLLELPISLRRYLVSVALEKMLGSLKDIEMRHIEDIMAILNKSAGKQLNLPRGLIFTVEYDKFLLGFGQAPLFPHPILDAEYSLNVPGVSIIPGWRIEAMIYHETDRFLNEDKGNNYIACFDLDKAGNWLTVRRRKKGDRFQPLGVSLPKKLGEFMIDAKIPAAWREHIPLVCSAEQVVWVVGWRIDDRVKLTPTTRQVLQLQFEPI